MYSGKIAVPPGGGGIDKVLSDVGNRIDGASPCKALIPICNVISKGKLCSNNSKSVLYLPIIYVSVARIAEVSYLLLLY
jgi:hypothetical protein